MTDKEVIAAIRKCHLKANISNPYYVRHYWDEAWLDGGGTIFGDGPYVHLPVDHLWEEGSDRTDRVVIRVYPPARLQRRLAKLWERQIGSGNQPPNAERADATRRSAAQKTSSSPSGETPRE